MALAKHRQQQCTVHWKTGIWQTKLILSWHLIQHQVTQEAKQAHVFCWSKKLRSSWWLWHADITSMNSLTAKAFETLIETSSGPQIKLFQRFAQAWTGINSAAFESGVSDDQLASHLNPMKEAMLAFLKSQLLTHQPRDDYWELLHLTILFLGDTSVCTTVHAPGSYHRARWMAKLTYCLKIYLFRSQFKLTKKEILVAGLQQFNLFIVTVYIKARFTSPSAASAPRQDLEMLSQLLEYKKSMNK